MGQVRCQGQVFWLWFLTLTSEKTKVKNREDVYFDAFTLAMASSLCSKRITCKSREGPSHWCLRLILTTWVASKITAFKLLFSSLPLFSQTVTVLPKTSEVQTHRFFGQTIYPITKKISCNLFPAVLLSSFHTVTVESMQRHKSRTLPNWHSRLATQAQYPIALKVNRWCSMEFEHEIHHLHPVSLK